MCGEHQGNVLPGVGVQGSSPHVRGARLFADSYTRYGGIIPACAGSTANGSTSMLTRWDHPRMCGEHFELRDGTGSYAGSSPHVRGARVERGVGGLVLGIIPACTGSTNSRTTRRAMHGDHPRMCGEHVDAVFAVRENEGSSPHVRGAHFENSIIPRKRKDNWLFFIQFRFENFLAFRYLLALLHPFLGVPTKDPSFASLGRLINCNPSQSTGDQSAPYTLKAICCSFLAE